MLSNIFCNSKIFIIVMQGENLLQITNLERSEFLKLRSVLVDIYLSAYKDMPEYAYNKRKSVKSYMDWLFKGDPSGFFVAKLNDKVVGFISCHGNWEDYREGKVCEIHEFAVKEEYKGRGIGKALLQRAIDYAISLGRKKVTLWVGEGNERAINLYLKMGFKPLYKAGIWVRMKKEL